MKSEIIEIEYEWDDEEYNPNLDDYEDVPRSVTCDVRITYDAGNYWQPPDTHAEIIEYDGDDFDEQIEDKILELAINEFWN